MSKRSETGNSVAFWAKTLGVAKDTVVRRLRRIEAGRKRRTLWQKSTSRQVEFVVFERDIVDAFPEHAERIVDAGKFAGIQAQLEEHRLAIANLTRALVVATGVGAQRRKPPHDAT